MRRLIRGGDRFVDARQDLGRNLHLPSDFVLLGCHVFTFFGELLGGDIDQFDASRFQFLLGAILGGSEVGAINADVGGP